MALNRIVCVEDDSDIREIIDLSLTEIGGFEVVTFDNCDDALFEIPAIAPDLVLIDVSMPNGMSGTELCSYLLDSPHVGNLCIAFLTAHAFDRELKYLEALAPVIKKPFDPMLLPDRVGSLYEAAQSRQCGQFRKGEARFSAAS